ncbi:MAG: hypothetical protein ACJAYU_002845 [Bradymonadia bacterium]
MEEAVSVELVQHELVLGPTEGEVTRDDGTSNDGEIIVDCDDPGCMGTATCVLDGDFTPCGMEAFIFDSYQIDIGPGGATLSGDTIGPESAFDSCVATSTLLVTTT